MKAVLPKGILIPIGGREDKENKKNILSRIVAETRKDKPVICLITLATDVPKEVVQEYRNAFISIGIHSISAIHFDSHREADSQVNMENIRACDAVMITGGDQLKLSSLLGGTELMQLIRERYIDEPNFVIAGTSAGAAAMSSTMIVSGSSPQAMLKGSLQLTNGLGLADNVFIDTHFIERGRLGRIIQSLLGNPGILGIGLAEDTGIIIQGENFEVIGSGIAVVIDASKVGYTNITDISESDPITVEDIILHMLGPGKKFSIIKKKLLLVN